MASAASTTTEVVNEDGPTCSITEKPVANLPTPPPSTSATETATTPSSSSPSPSTKPSSPSKKGPNSASTITALAATDDFLSHLQRGSQLRYDADGVVFFLAYSCRFSGTLLEMASRAALRQAAQNLIDIASRLPPQAALTFEGAGTRLVSPAASLALQFSARLRALGSTLTDMRAFNRMWSLLGMYQSAKALLRKPTKGEKEEEDDRTPAERRFDVIMGSLVLLFGAVYQATENVGWLLSKNVVIMPKRAAAKMSLVSGRAWAISLVLDIIRLIAVRRRKVRAAGGKLPEKDAAWDALWKREFCRQLAWSPMAANFCVEGGLMPEWLFSIFGLYLGTSRIRQTWNDNA